MAECAVQLKRAQRLRVRVVLGRDVERTDTGPGILTRTRPPKNVSSVASQASH